MVTLRRNRELSPQARDRLARGIGDPPVARPDLSDHDAVRRWRAAVHAAWGEGSSAGEAPHRRRTLAGRPALVAGPPPAETVTLLYLHGGGYVLGSAAVAAPITARLARHLHVVSLDYRLAPEHPFPAALDDAVAAHRELAASCGRPVAVGGDSAGGALALGVALRAQLDAPGAPTPAAIVALCPHLAHEPGGAAATLTEAYRAGTPPRHPMLSPLHADPASLAALPPTLIQAAALDPLSAQTQRLAVRAEAAGAPLTVEVWDGLWHTWHYHRELPEAHAALDEAAAFVLRAVRQADAPIDPRRVT